MNINTNTGNLVPTKHELKRLKEASEIAALIEKHGDGELAKNAGEAATALGDVLTALAEQDEPALPLPY